MIPSRRWFPLSLQERAAWFDNFRNVFSVNGVSLGFTPANIASVENDNTCVQFLAATAVSLEAFKNAVLQYRVIVTEGKIGEPTPAFPANVGFRA